MNIGTLKNFTDLKQHLNDPLFKNSYFLMANNIIIMGIGFLFWLIVARLYSPTELGLASAIISAMTLLYSFSLFGLDIGLIRYLPDEKNKDKMINSCFTITTIIALLISIIFILGLDIWSPALIILKNNLLLGIFFIIFTIFSSLFYLQVSIFTASRKTKYSFLQSLVNLLKIRVLPLLTVFSTFGIYISFGLSSIITFFAGNRFISRIYKHYKIVPIIEKKYYI